MLCLHTLLDQRQRMLGPRLYSASRVHLVRHYPRQNLVSGDDRAERRAHSHLAPPGPRAPPDQRDALSVRALESAPAHAGARVPAPYISRFLISFATSLVSGYDTSRSDHTHMKQPLSHRPLLISEVLRLYALLDQRQRMPGPRFQSSSRVGLVGKHPQRTQRS